MLDHVRKPASGPKSFSTFGTIKVLCGYFPPSLSWFMFAGGFKFLTTQLKHVSPSNGETSPYDASKREETPPNGGNMWQQRGFLFNKRLRNSNPVSNFGAFELSKSFISSVSDFQPYMVDVCM